VTGQFIVQPQYSRAEAIETADAVVAGSCSDGPPIRRRLAPHRYPHRLAKGHLRDLRARVPEASLSSVRQGVQMVLK
jgi:hypothetical protein